MILRFAAAGVLLGCLLTGCTSTTTSNTPRTATEQLLISNAVDDALDKVNFTPFAGADVLLEEKYVDGVDTKYLVGSVRHRLLHAGARLVDKPEDADLVLELRSGGIGTAASESFLGSPEIVLPGMMTIPEVHVLERKRQQGAAKIGMVAYDARTREILGGGGVALSRSDDSNWFVAGIGPFQTGSMKDEIETRTTGQSAYKQQTLPQQVAFQGPRRLPADQPGGEDIRHVSFPQNLNPAPPAAQP